MCFGVPKTTPVFDDLLGKLNRTQCRVIIMAKIYYSKRTQSKFSKGKRHMGRSLGEPGTSSGKSTPRESYRMPFIPPAMSYDNRGKLLSVWKAHPNLGAKNFYWGRVPWAPLPGRHHTSRPPERKQVSSSNCIVCTRNIGSVFPSY